jgi:hypothetical protein
MSWLDTLRDRGLQAKRVAEPEVFPRPRAPKPDIMTVYVQTRHSSQGDPGAVIIGHYSVQDDTVVLHAEDGKPTGKRHRLSPDEDPKQVAWRLTRDAKSVAPDFNRPLNYPNVGVV